MYLGAYLTYLILDLCLRAALACKVPVVSVTALYSKSMHMAGYSSDF